MYFVYRMDSSRCISLSIAHRFCSQIHSAKAMSSFAGVVEYQTGLFGSFGSRSAAISVTRAASSDQRRSGRNSPHQRDGGCR
jgi:hypothetical protein